jgi:hypothetical protein
MSIKYTKSLKYSNAHKIYQMALNIRMSIKYNNIFHSKILQKYPKSGIFGMKICMSSGNRASEHWDSHAAQNNIRRTKNLSKKQNVQLKQGDQIRRIFAST